MSRALRKPSRMWQPGRFSWCLLGCFALSLCPSAASLAQGERLSEEKKRQIDAVFERWDREGSPGAAVAVVRGGETIYLAGYGSAQLKYGVEITPQTVFHVASVSKQFTNFAALLLEKKGLLALDDPVQKYVPEVPDFGKEITLRHLVHHTSGLRDQWELLVMAGWRLDDVITKDQILRVVSRQRELNFEPGAEHLYCNTGYTLLAETTSRVSGKSFRELTQELIFDPLRMTRSHMHESHEHIVPGRAYSYAPDGDGFKKSVLSYANAGATSLFTTAEDMARWLVNLESGAVGGSELVSSMATRGVLNDGKEIDYAVGLVNGKVRGVQTLGHGGADAGFRSWAGLFPEHDLGVVVLSNLANFDAGGRAMEVAEVVLGEIFEPLEDTAGGSGDTVDLTEEELARAVGRYQLNIGAMLQILRRGRWLEAEAPSLPAATLQPRTPASFWLEEQSAMLRFEAPATGSNEPFQSMVIEMPGARIEGRRVEPIDGDALDRLVGSYWSAELESSYRIEKAASGLVARHQRHDAIELTAIEPDEVAGDAWWFGRAAFESSESGDVLGFRLTGSRVRNLWFEKQAEGSPAAARKDLP